jgi:hypothetical protein
VRWAPKAPRLDGSCFVARWRRGVGSDGTIGWRSGAS